MNNRHSTASFISLRAFISALIIILALMVCTYLLTLALPCPGIALGKWFLSPFLILGSSDGAMFIGLIVFLLAIGGAFQAMNTSGMTLYMIGALTERFQSSKYKLMAGLILFFMSMGSLLGSFEEVVPMTPIIAALAVNLGWDALTGIGMSLLAAGCGFAAGVFNPFTVGLAQSISGLPMFSGTWFRALSFILIYVLLFIFLRTYAAKTDRGTSDGNTPAFEQNAGMEKALKAFGLIIGIGLAVVFSSALLTFLRDYTIIIVALMFFLAGTISCFVSGMRARMFFSEFAKGLGSVVPAILLILMAGSIKFTLQESGAFEIIIEWSTRTASSMPRWLLILFIYLFVLVMNFFVASGSAKAIMLMPLITPIAGAFGISAQLCVSAFAFGDGFSNVLYPTNPALLISLGLSGISYTRWFKWSIRFQLVNLVLTASILLFGLALGI